jgi:Na+/proline symporter
MGMWQRIAGAQKPESALGGLSKSVFGSALSWGLFVILACLALMIVVPVDGTNPLLTLLNSVGNGNGTWGLIVIFLVVIGLFGAMLSTASTQLIAVSHAIYEDIISRLRKLSLTQRLDSKSELRLSRLILVASAIIATGFVQLLSHFGFSIADLVFAIYGAQLGLFPPIALALFTRKNQFRKFSIWAILSIIVGFLSGWGSAIYGKLIMDGNLVFLAPVVSLIGSSLFVGIGLIATKPK